MTMHHCNPRIRSKYWTSTERNPTWTQGPLSKKMREPRPNLACSIWPIYTSSQMTSNQPPSRLKTSSSDGIIALGTCPLIVCPRKGFYRSGYSNATSHYASPGSMASSQGSLGDRRGGGGGGGDEPNQEGNLIQSDRLCQPTRVLNSRLHRSTQGQTHNAKVLVRNSVCGPTFAACLRLPTMDYHQCRDCPSQAQL